MRAQYSDPIAVADATATTFDLGPNATSVRIGVIFYDDAAAAAEDEVAAGSGNRDIAVSLVVPLEDYGVNVMPIVGASVEDNPAHALKAFDLGGPTSRISVACAQATDPGGATHYRIVCVD